MVKHIYSGEAALTGTDRVGLIVRVIRRNNKSQQLSRSPITVSQSQLQIFTVGAAMADMSSDSDGVMVYREERENITEDSV